MPGNPRLGVCDIYAYQVTFDRGKIIKKKSYTTKKRTKNMDNYIYCVSKRMEIAGAHRLNLSYESKCQRFDCDDSREDQCMKQGKL